MSSGFHRSWSMAFSCALLMLSIHPVSLAGQGGTITGQVVDGQTLQPIAAAQISVDGTGIGTLSAQNGRYTLNGVPSGAVRLTVQSIGFQSTNREVTVVAGETVTVDVQLAQTALELDAIIVTGTPGGTQRRAIGNAVTDLSTARLTERADVQNMQQLLTGRTPGLQLSRASSGVGTGGEVRIRGINSMSLSQQPLIFVDGVRVDNSTNRGPSQVVGAGSTSALDDFNPEDIESIEIVKGPAAATLYGTEASAGVIQIITKRGSTGAPQFTASITQGANWIMDPSGRLGETWGTVDGELVQFGYDGDRTYSNLYEYEKHARGNDPLQYGHRQAYDLSVRGGTDFGRYFVAMGYEDSGGPVSYNWNNRLNLRANVTALLGPLTLDVSTGYTDTETSYPTSLAGEDLWRMLFWGQVHTQNDPVDRGFLRGTPEDFETLESLRSLSRFTGSMVATNRLFSDRLTQRLTLGLDRSSEESHNLIPFHPDGVNARWGVRNLGEIEMWRPLTTVQTADYSLSFRQPITDWLTSTSSFGMQYYSREYDMMHSFGRRFTAPAIRSIAGAAEKDVTQTFIENKSFGMYVQQEIGINDRFFLTGAVRGDDNSAFGTEYDAAIYPKISGAWVISEEPFFNVPHINTFRLRAAWGKAGRQPETFAATTRFSSRTGPAGAPAVGPETLGNPELGPEVTSELELGFEVSALGERLSGEFTYFDQKTVDALTPFPLPPSAGFPGTQTVNIGRLDNWGLEGMLNWRAIQRPRLSIDVDLFATYTMNEIKDLGGRAQTQNLREGFPYPAVTSDIIRWAELDETGTMPNRDTMICDGGSGPDGRRRGGADVLCTTMVGKQLLLGPRFHPWTFGGNVTASLSQFEVFVSADGRTGGWNQDNNLQGAGLGAYNSTLASNLRNDPAYLETRLFPSRTPTDLTISILYPGGFLKLREVGLRYRIPDSVVDRMGASSATLGISARELATLWQQAKEVSSGRIADPESQGGPDGLSTFYGGFPPISSFAVTLRAQF